MKKKLIRVTTIAYSFVGLLKDQLKFMSSTYDIIAVSSPQNGYLHEFGKSNGISVRPVEMTRQITPLKDLRAAWYLYRLFRKERPFIVHSHTPKAGTLAMIAAYLAKVPNRLHTIAGLPLLEQKGFKRIILDIVEKITYAAATKIYPNSFGLSEIIISQGYCKKSKVKVIGNGSSNGIDTKFFDPSLFTDQSKKALKKLLAITDQDFIFIFVGRIVKDKGIDELVIAFDKLSAKYLNITLLLVGRFEDDLDPINFNSKKIIENNTKIKLLGPQHDVRPYYSIANALVFPSYREGFPNVVMEAASMGLLSIVSDINGCNEIIENGKNGIIIPPKNIMALYDAMDRVKKGNLSEYLSPFHIRERIKTKYDREIQWTNILNEYMSLDR